MNGQFGSNYGGWKSTRGMGAAQGSRQLGGWSGSLYADGARIFVTPSGEAVGDERTQRVVNGLGRGSRNIGAVAALGVMGASSNTAGLGAVPLASPLGSYPQTVTPYGHAVAPLVGHEMGHMTGPYGGAYGEASAEDIVTSTSESAHSPFVQTITELVPAITTIVEATQDPYRRYEMAKARLENARARGASSSTINKLEAKVTAAAQRLGLKEEGVMATRQWRALGQTASVVGIGVGLTLAFFIIVKALK